MRVLVAGATGAIGKELVPRLVDAGHEVFAMVRSESSKARAAQLGAVPVIADALDRAQVEAAVRQAGAEPVVLGIARDERASLRALMAEGLQADALVTSAGVSMSCHQAASGSGTARRGQISASREIAPARP